MPPLALTEMAMSCFGPHGSGTWNTNTSLLLNYARSRRLRTAGSWYQSCNAESRQKINSNDKYLKLQRSALQDTQDLGVVPRGRCWRISRIVALMGFLGIGSNIGFCHIGLELLRRDKERGVSGVSLMTLRIILMQVSSNLLTEPWRSSALSLPLRWVLTNQHKADWSQTLMGRRACWAEYFEQL